mmetsp:Transcript_12120/g.17551  ORF Transcript_12120/g.17551 Transcript_12120/m.17551 type:complete len:268 (+) Transcript_12120:55-858(+)
MDIDGPSPPSSPSEAPSSPQLSTQKDSGEVLKDENNVSDAQDVAVNSPNDAASNTNSNGDGVVSVNGNTASASTSPPPPIEEENTNDNENVDTDENNAPVSSGDEEAEQDAKSNDSTSSVSGEESAKNQNANFSSIDGESPSPQSLPQSVEDTSTTLPDPPTNEQPNIPDSNESKKKMNTSKQSVVPGPPPFVNDPDKITFKFIFANRDGVNVILDCKPGDTVGETKGALLSMWPDGEFYFFFLDRFLFLGFCVLHRFFGSEYPSIN